MKKTLPESTQKCFLNTAFGLSQCRVLQPTREKKMGKGLHLPKGNLESYWTRNLFNTFLYTNTLYTNTLYHITRLNISNQSNLTVNRPLLVLQKFRQTRSLETALIKDSLESVYHKASLEGYPSRSLHTSRSPSTVRGSHNNFSEFN